MSDDGGVQVEVQSDPIAIAGDESVISIAEDEVSPIVVTVDEECVDIVLAVEGDPVLAVVVDVSEDPILVQILQTELITVEVGQQGPAGPEGPTGPPGSPGGTIPESKFKFYQVLVGTIDGANTTFTLPGGDKARNADPGFMVIVLYNGQELLQGAGADFTVSESGGAGTGFDTVSLNFAPIGGPRPDVLWSHYVLL